MTDEILAQIENARRSGNVINDDNTWYSVRVHPSQIETVRAFLGETGVTYQSDGTIMVDPSRDGAPSWDRVQMALSMVSGNVDLRIDDDLLGHIG